MYAHDARHRLPDFTRGALNAEGTAITTPTPSEDLPERQRWPAGEEPSVQRFAQRTLRAGPVARVTLEPYLARGVPIRAAPVGERPSGVGRLDRVRFLTVTVRIRCTRRTVRIRCPTTVVRAVAAGLGR